MDKDRQKDFARRVSQANKTELVVITYDIIVCEINRAEECIKSEDKEGAREALRSALRFLAEMMSSLDFRYGIAKSLMSLYEYVQRVLVASCVSGEDRGLDSAAGVLKGLGSSFAQIAAQDNSGAVMENTQSVYAGLTYGRGSLNEMNMTDGTNRGFLA